VTLFQIEKVADEVLDAHACNTAPIDVCAIVHAEGIQLADGDYGSDFSGRIEYHADVSGFILFHPSLELARYPSRVRFSIGHELGHYFLDHHRERLLAGATHNSTSDFICDDALEREADEFAAALLIPSFALRERMFRRSFMTLTEVLKLAEVWQSSATSAAIRYAKFTREACIVVLSRCGKVLFWVPSEEAVALGFKFLAKDRHVPRGVPTALVSDGGAVHGAGVSSELWFPQRYRRTDLWEDACQLGGTGRVLTLLSLDS